MSDVTLRTVEELIDHGLALAEDLDALTEVAGRYAVAVPPTMRHLIDPADLADPIALQFVPRRSEIETTPEERADPIGDAAHSPCEGLVHRYPDRVLLKLVQVCAVYCRFCFRREMIGPGKPAALSGSALDRAMAYIAARPDIWEVILTGGDPLSASPRRLRAVAGALAAIPHVKVLRVHTRIPVVDPARVTRGLVEVLQASGKTLYVAIHANHPRELTPEARAACALLADAGASLVSQTVLLRGVNDDVTTLAALMRGFVEARVKPYYLHHPDLAPGTAHFRLSISEGQALVRQLRGRVSGLCQPTYVLDIPGGRGKAPIGPCEVGRDEDGAERIVDFNGIAHRYPPAA